MPYIATDLDAFDDAQAVAGATGLSPPQALGGQLAAFFCSAAPGLAAALVAFGFLEAKGDTYRVRGVDRYLRLSEARRKGGLAARSNLVPGARQKKASFLSTSPEAAQTLPGITSGSDSALSAKVEGRRSKVEREEEDLVEVAALRDGWNTLTSPPLPRWTPKSKLLTRLAVAAVKRRPLREWMLVFQRIEASPKLRGEDPSLGGWKADAAWALRAEGNKPEPAQAVLDGKWDQPAQGLQRAASGRVPNGAATAADKDWS